MLFVARVKIYDSDGIISRTAGECQPGEAETAIPHAHMSTVLFELVVIALRGMSG